MCRDRAAVEERAAEPAAATVVTPAAAANNSGCPPDTLADRLRKAGYRSWDSSCDVSDWPPPPNPEWLVPAPAPTGSGGKTVVTHGKPQHHGDVNAATLVARGIRWERELDPRHGRPRRPTAYYYGTNGKPIRCEDGCWRLLPDTIAEDLERAWIAALRKQVSARGSHHVVRLTSDLCLDGDPPGVVYTYLVQPESACVEYRDGGRGTRSTNGASRAVRRVDVGAPSATSDGSFVHERAGVRWERLIDVEGMRVWVPYPARDAHRFEVARMHDRVDSLQVDGDAAFLPGARLSFNFALRDMHGRPAMVEKNLDVEPRPTTVPMRRVDDDTPEYECHHESSVDLTS